MGYWKINKRFADSIYITWMTVIKNHPESKKYYTIDPIPIKEKKCVKIKDKVKKETWKEVVEKRFELCNEAKIEMKVEAKVPKMIHKKKIEKICPTCRKRFYDDFKVKYCSLECIPYGRYIKTY